MVVVGDIVRRRKGRWAREEMKGERGVGGMLAV